MMTRTSPVSSSSPYLSTSTVDSMLEPGLGLMSSLRWPLGMRCGFQALGNRNPTVEGLTHCGPPYKPHQAGLEPPGRTYVATSRHGEAVLIHVRAGRVLVRTALRPRAVGIIVGILR